MGFIYMNFICILFYCEYVFISWVEWYFVWWVGSGNNGVVIVVCNYIIRLYI